PIPAEPGPPSPPQTPSIDTTDPEKTRSIITEAEYRYNTLIKQFPSKAEPAFHAEDEQKMVWCQVWGCDNDVGQIRKVLVHRPGEELNVIDPSKRIEGINAFGEVDKGWYWRGDSIPSL